MPVFELLSQELLQLFLLDPPRPGQVGVVQSLVGVGLLALAEHSVVEGVAAVQGNGEVVKGLIVKRAGRVEERVERTAVDIEFRVFFSGIDLKYNEMAFHML